MKFTKSYDPGEFEPQIYQEWEKSGAFLPKKRAIDSSEEETEGSYSIVMPPPNANGNLHIGHGLTIAIEDSLARYYRLRGRSTWYIPGADHAGFETWVVYERALEKEGHSRFEYSRDELYARVWDFVEQQRGNMELQLRALGTSCAWDDLTFTLDENVVSRVYQTFEKMWKDGMVYRGKKLVNFCPKHQTAFADIEVDYREEKTPLYYIKYGPFTLATTRPETKFGDTAVAVNPNDERYQEWVGKTITVEGVDGPFEVDVIADEMVDMEFGTGVVKITPAHDFNDWEVGQRHNLRVVQVIDEEGKMTEVAGRFAGLSVQEARKAVVKAMDEMGLIVKIDEDYVTKVPHCYKCGAVIEPMLKEQWFIDVKKLAREAIRHLENNEIKFYPSSKKKILIEYLKNLKDWNISRQIPWGIPIPAFRRVSEPTLSASSLSESPVRALRTSKYGSLARFDSSANKLDTEGSRNASGRSALSKSSSTQSQDLKSSSFRASDSPSISSQSTSLKGSASFDDCESRSVGDSANKLDTEGSRNASDLPESLEDRHKHLTNNEKCGRMEGSPAKGAICSSEKMSQGDDLPEWIFDTRTNLPEIEIGGVKYVRDEDTFDTWFSSSQWPVVCTDWIEETIADNGQASSSEGAMLAHTARSAEAGKASSVTGVKSRENAYYPLNVMETGADLLFAWVARMIMMGIYTTGEVPFREVYLHGMVLDAHGKKMSKSKGNVINPIELVTKYGSDAFRLGIMRGRSAGMNQAFSENSVVAGRNLCNKLWNISRFIQGMVDESKSGSVRALEIADAEAKAEIVNEGQVRAGAEIPYSTDNMGEDWICRQLTACKEKLEDDFANYRFAEAVERITATIWDEYADWFIESQKLYKNVPLLKVTLEMILKMLHPFAPFVTEAIWRSLSWTEGLLMTQKWPSRLKFDPISAANFDSLVSVVVEARRVSNELSVASKGKRFGLLYGDDALVDDNSLLVASLTKAPSITSCEGQPRGLRLAIANHEVYLDVPQEVVAKHREVLEERILAVGRELDALNLRMTNPNYVDKAPAKLVQQTRDGIKEKEELIERLKKELEVI